MVTKKSTKATPAVKPASRTASRTAASSSASEFPKKELDKWLKAHKTWNHDDWLELLKDLKAKGYGDLVGKKAGQGSVGLYLETNRKK